MKVETAEKNRESKVEPHSYFRVLDEKGPSDPRRTI